jgi:hypothetical protein
VLSSLEDQVERKVLRAQRASRLSRSLVDVSKTELMSHSLWLDRHCDAWTEEVRRYSRLLNRKIAYRALIRVAFGFIRAPHRPLFQAFQWILKQRSSGGSQPSPPETILKRTGHAQLQHRICTLEVTRAGIPSSTVGRFKNEADCSSGARFLPGRGVSSKGTVLVSGLGLIALVVVAAGALRETLPKAPAILARELPHKPASTPAPSLPKAPANALGFSVLAITSAPEPLLLPAPTIAGLMSITSPLALEPIGREDRTTPPAIEPLTSKPAVLTKPNRKLAARKRPQLPWLQQLPWIKVR